MDGINLHQSFLKVSEQTQTVLYLEFSATGNAALGALHTVNQTLSG